MTACFAYMFCPACSDAGCCTDLQLLVQHPQHAQQSFPVHRMMLQLRCPLLAALADSAADTIIINDIEPHVAKAMLHAIYTGVHCIEAAVSACTCHWQRTALHQSFALLLAILCCAYCVFYKLCALCN
jgi:hypothetical protein